LLLLCLFNGDADRGLNIPHVTSGRAKKANSQRKFNEVHKDKYRIAEKKLRKCKSAKGNKNDRFHRKTSVVHHVPSMSNHTKIFAAAHNNSCTPRSWFCTKTEELQRWDSL